MHGTRVTPMRQRLRAAWREWNVARWSRYTDPEALCRDHFKRRSGLDHVNYDSLRNLLRLMGGRPQVILETGMSAWGTDSTRLFDAYVRSFGGAFWSVDIRPEAVDALRDWVGPDTVLTCDDSVAFLARWVAENPGRAADVVYLDSWDVDDWGDPIAAAEHCMRELEAVRPALQPGSLLLIDDSPGEAKLIPGDDHERYESLHREHGAWPGKGMLVELELRRQHIEPVFHEYQALYRF
jgi:hypothetical protein